MGRIPKVVLMLTAVTATIAIVAAGVALPYVAERLVAGLARSKAAELGLPCRATAKVNYRWRGGPGIEGRLRLTRVHGEGTLSAELFASLAGWTAKAQLPELRVDEQDEFVRTMLEQHPIATLSNLTFSGSVALTAEAEWRLTRPVIQWKAKVPVRELKVDALAGERPLCAEGVSVTLAALGIADHLDLEPIRLRAQTLNGAGLAMTNLNATIRATERMLMISEARAGFCGGEVSVYSLFLDPRKLNTGFTLFVDDLDAGMALGYIRGFKGEASGRLHGKFKAFVREGGSSVRLSDAFLYSTPGQPGKLRVYESGELTENLALAGLDEATQKNISAALADLDYSVLRLDLARLEERQARLTLQLKGTAKRQEQEVPVDLTVNFNGELEQLINTGLGYSAKMKGKQ